jgi:hypothetical protein
VRDRLRALWLATTSFAVLGSSAAFLGCSAPEALGGQGAPCALATDCQEGLVCISMMNQPRQCSNDLVAIQFVEDAAGPGAGAEAGAAPPSADAAPDDAATSMRSDGPPAPPPDSGSTLPDATTGAQDAAPSNDSGGNGNGADRAAPPDDAGQADATTPLPDAAQPLPDAAQPLDDSGD